MGGLVPLWPVATSTSVLCSRRVLVLVSTTVGERARVASLCCGLVCVGPTLPNWLSRPLEARFKREFPAVDLTVSSQDHVMQSILEILVINTKTGTSKKSGNAYSIPEAQCVLRNDDGSVAAVGVLVIPKHLEEVAKPGMFTGSFALEAATFGENQGRIVAKLTGLTLVPPSAQRRPQQPSQPS
jgi:hypothetical protein